jgi:uncharacterized damage-inducible protein DinB
MVEKLRSLYAYLQWANWRVLKVAEEIPAEAYAREFDISFKSLHGTLAHMLGAEWLWFERFHGRSPTSIPGFKTWTTAAQLASAWNPVRETQTHFLAHLKPVDLKSRLTYRNLAGEEKSYVLGDALLHCANHATFHRGQVVQLLRQLGATPPTTDYIFFLDNPG